MFEMNMLLQCTAEYQHAEQRQYLSMFYVVILPPKQTNKQTNKQTMRTSPNVSQEGVQKRFIRRSTETPV